MINENNIESLLKKYTGDITDENIKVILPIIRKVIPNLLASKIVSAQPILGINEKYIVLKTEDIDGKIWYNIKCTDIIHKWVIDTIDKSQFSDESNKYEHKLKLSEETMLLLKLKWS